eukprot:10536245-Karenia_brevis.AAC.1
MLPSDGMSLTISSMFRWSILELRSHVLDTIINVQIVATRASQSLQGCDVRLQVSITCHRRVAACHSPPYALYIKKAKTVADESDAMTINV